MNILMMTNTYLPHTGGVARSVAWFSDAFRQQGHRVVVVAPTYEGAEEPEPDVIRVPAIQKFNGSDFSVRLPIPGLMASSLEEFEPHIIHAHHPFLLGDTALRVAAQRALPIVFTHHTMYERYTHYVPGDSPAMQRFAVRLATEFANLCDHVIAPSESIAEVLRERGVTVPITPIPTGIDPRKFCYGDGLRARARYGIPPDAPLIGHVGRLAPEKNLGFLTQAIVQCLQSHPSAHFLLVGCGPSEPTICEAFERAGLGARFHHPPGSLDGETLADAYNAMDVFAFASHSETQGMVLAEAMTTGVPVVALDAPGAREIVQDGVNGRLLVTEDANTLADALAQILTLAPAQRLAMEQAARRTADEFSLTRCAARLLDVYQQAIASESKAHEVDRSTWGAMLRRLEEEWNIWASVTQAVGDALFGSGPFDKAEAP
jgi:glycosyltransferase involved in cell wall biosynthesis